jgi:DNA-binding transcriptional ArsR family regulator
MTMLAQEKMSSLPIKKWIDDNPDLKLIQVAAHSTRLYILHLLLNQRMYPTQLEKELGIPRRVISFHLDALEKAKLVESEFGLSGDNRPQAVRYYSITSKGKEIYQLLLDMRRK